MEPFTDQQACQCHPMNLYDQNHLDPRCPFYGGAPEARVDNHPYIKPERDGSIHAPIDFFFHERMRLEMRVAGPLERADHILAGYGGSFAKPLLSMEQARELIGQAYKELGYIMDLYETASRGIIREHAKLQAMKLEHMLRTKEIPDA